MCNIVKFKQFLGFYSKFCFGWTKNEVHICYLHSKTQLLMYDKGGILNKRYFISRRWMENNQEARTGGKHQNFWKKNIYTLLISIKEQLWRVFKLNFDFLSFFRLPSVGYNTSERMKSLIIYVCNSEATSWQSGSLFTKGHQ